jgi:nicotinamidase-related amidase
MEDKFMDKILIVVDMQNDFVDGALGSKEAEAIVDKVVKKIENFEGEIIVTFDTHQDNYLETREGKYLPVLHCIEGTDGHKLNKKVEDALVGKGAYDIYKPTFGSVHLVEYIRDIMNG